MRNAAIEVKLKSPVMIMPTHDIKLSHRSTPKISRSRTNRESLMNHIQGPYTDSLMSDSCRRIVSDQRMTESVLLSALTISCSFEKSRTVISHWCNPYAPPLIAN